MLIQVTPKIAIPPEPQSLRTILCCPGYLGTVWRRVGNTPDYLVIAESSSPDYARAVVIRGDTLIVVESGSNEWMSGSQWIRYEGNITVTA